MGALLGTALTGAAADGCERVNAKYRVGDSLRVAYRIECRGTRHTVAGRTFAGRSASVYRRALAAAVPAGELSPVVHAPELETVFWTFPNDRRLRALRHLDGGSVLDRLVGHAGARTRLVAYAPERAATAQCLDADGRVLAYVKAHWDAAERELRNIEAAAAAIDTGDAHLRVPRVLAASLEEGLLVLEPLEGRRLDGLAVLALGPALRRLGAALATLHRVRPLPARTFNRVEESRLVAAAEVVALARPDCGAEAARLLACVLDRRADGEGPVVHLHGDTNLRNALECGHRVALVDLEDAAAGPAAADLGFVLASLRVARVQGRIAASQERALGDELVSGYAALAPAPGESALRWHAAASVLARVAVPAVGRVRPNALERLEPLLHSARSLLA
jgi:aminoglycoside phosphotransferase (APT) family kinase protein